MAVIGGMWVARRAGNREKRVVMVPMTNTDWTNVGASTSSFRESDIRKIWELSWRGISAAVKPTAVAAPAKAPRMAPVKDRTAASSTT